MPQMYLSDFGCSTASFEAADAEAASTGAAVVENDSIFLYNCFQFYSKRFYRILKLSAPILVAAE